MKKIISHFLVSLVLFAQAAIAETIYKGQDANGEPSFSDKPMPNSQKIEINPIPTYTPAPLPVPAPTANSSSHNPSSITAYEVIITQPQDDETFTTDIQEVSVHVTVSPNLQANDKIRYVLNGNSYGELTNQLTISLGRLDRGSYVIKAEVIGPDGHMKGESKTVTFYQNRTTILNKNNHPPPP